MLKATLSFASHWSRCHQLITQQKHPRVAHCVSIRPVHWECSVKSANGFLVLRKEGSDKPKSQAGEIGRGIKRTLLGRVPSSFQAAEIFFFIVFITSKRVGWYIIISLQCIRQIVFIFGGRGAVLREGWMTCLVTHPGGLGLELTSARLRALLTHGIVLLLTAATRPEQDILPFYKTPSTPSGQAPQLSHTTLTRSPELPGRNHFTC